MLDWRKSIKSEWKKLSQKQPEINNFSKYCTSIENWVRGCPYYLINRFMLCKHLVNLKGPVDPSLFQILKRNNQYPFLILDRSPMHAPVHKRNNTYSENNTHSDRNANIT